jgi:predicted small metal-binding protein
MKTLTCAQMGGTCDAGISAETKEEMMEKGMAHLDEAHPEMAADVKAMPSDAPEMVEWREKFDAAWDAAPEDAAPDAEAAAPAEEAPAEEPAA